MKYDQMNNEAAFEAPLDTAPLCAECGKRIPMGRCLPVEDGVLCISCIRYRLVEVEDL